MTWHGPGEKHFVCVYVFVSACVQVCYGVSVCFREREAMYLCVCVCVFVCAKLYSPKL